MSAAPHRGVGWEKLVGSLSPVNHKGLHLELKKGCVNRDGIVYCAAYGLRMYNIHHKWRPGMSDVSVLSGITGLSFDSNFLSPALVLLPAAVALSVLSLFSC